MPSEIISQLDFVLIYNGQKKGAQLAPCSLKDV